MAEKRIVAAYPLTIEGKDVRPDEVVVVEETTALKLILEGLAREEDRQAAPVVAVEGEATAPAIGLTKGGK